VCSGRGRTAHRDYLTRSPRQVRAKLARGPASGCPRDGTDDPSYVASCLRGRCSRRLRLARASYSTRWAGSIMVRLLLPLANGGRAHLLYRARGRDPATGRCLPSRSNFRTGEEMTVPHTPRARARTKKVGGQIFPLGRPRPPLLMVRRCARVARRRDDPRLVNTRARALGSPGALGCRCGGWGALAARRGATRAAARGHEHVDPVTLNF